MVRLRPPFQFIEAALQRVGGGKGTMAHLLTVNGLSVAFRGEGVDNTYVDGVGFHVDAGETVCIVGESGCGKSVTVLSLMGLLGENGRVTAGEALFDGQDLLALPAAALDRVRGNTLTMIFQDAMSSLNPVLTVGAQLTEAIQAHMALPKAEARARAQQLLGRVGLAEPQRVMRQYPHVLSGGMRQRVMIAMALCCGPKLLIADEPTTALDVTIQAQIMRLLRELKNEYGMALLLITHDMGLVAEMADRVLVMYAGQVVEEADVRTLFRNPRHPYTQALLRSVPNLHDRMGRRLDAIRGVVPERYEQLAGCRFFSRCERAVPQCEHMSQPLVPITEATQARCWLAGAGDAPATGKAETPETWMGSDNVAALQDVIRTLGGQAPQAAPGANTAAGDTEGGRSR
jgi:oligopeptide/dipeptide ABC transporter ATP-binding protein